jgi:hypothetical protein
LTDYRGSRCGLRRAIAAAWGHGLERKEGEKGEEMEGFIGRSRGGNWCLNLPGIKSGKHSLAAGNCRVDGGRRKKTDQWDPMSAREGGKRRDTGSFCFPGLRAGFTSGPKGFP